MSVWSRFILSIGLLHTIACEEKDTGLPDIDNDGVIDSEDCDAQNAAINASATDTVGDDIDQNCDGIDGTDAMEMDFTLVSGVQTVMMTILMRMSSEMVFMRTKTAITGFRDDSLFM